MLRTYLILAITLLSCSSSKVDARAQWIVVDLPNQDKAWRICSEKYDGLALHRKGFCYRIKECRKRFLRKRECRPVQQYCKFGDDPCFSKHGLYDKRLQ